MSSRSRRSAATAAAEPSSEPEPEEESDSDGFVDATGSEVARLSQQLVGLEGLIGRLVGTVEAQNEKFATGAAAQVALVARLDKLEEAVVASPPAAAAAASVGAVAAAAAPLTALEARLLKLEQAAARNKDADGDADPDDELDYVPYYEGRGLNPHQVRPNGVSDKPQLYPLKEGGYEVYKYLFGKKNAAYHEIGTLACALSYFWDALHLLESWKEKFGACGDENAPLAVEALNNC
eukprot:SAG11_NODE_434_length_9506_cov_5.089295_3_plen_236_part_00